MTLYARRWQSLPILAGELCPGLLVRLPEAYAPVEYGYSGAWSYVSIVLHWPDDPLPAQHGLVHGDVLEARRLKLSATHVLVHMTTDGPDGTDTEWYEIPRTTELQVLVRIDRYGQLEVGIWPEPLEDLAREEEPVV